MSTVAKAAAQAGKAAAKGAESHVLKQGAKRDPELYVRLVYLELLSLPRPESSV
jgi:hypothetical protein